MAQMAGQCELLKCLFCGKSQEEVQQLVAGPRVYICDHCIDHCNNIVQAERASGAEGGIGRGEVR